MISRTLPISWRRCASDCSPNARGRRCRGGSTPNTSPAPGSTLRGTPTSTIEQRRDRRGAPSPPRSSPRSTSDLGRAGGREQHVARDRATSGSSSSGIGAAADPRGELLGARRGAVGDDDLARRPRPRARAPCPRPSRRRRARAPGGRRACRAGWPPARPRPTTPTPRGGRCAVSVRARLPTSTAWRNVRESSGPLAPSRSAALPRLAHLAEDLALADDHRVEPGGHAEQVRDRGVVVVRVEEVGELVGVDARRVGEEVAHVLHRRVEQRGVGVDLGAVARGEQHDLGEVLAPRERLERLRAAPSGATAMRSSSSTGTVRWLRPTTTRDMPRSISLASSTRPARIRSSMPESRADCQSASSLERPAARSSSRASRQHVEQGRVLGAQLVSAARRRSHVASAGLRPPVPIVTTRSPWRTTDIRVNEQFAGSSAEFTQTRRASPASKTAWSTVGIAGGGGGEPGVVEVGGLERRARPASSRPASAHAAHLVADRRARPRARRRPPSSSASILRAAMRPAPTTTQRRPGDDEVHRVAGDRRPRPSSSPSRGASAVRRSRATRRRCAALLVEGQDLQLDREVDLAQRHAVGRGHDRRARS